MRDEPDQSNADIDADIVEVLERVNFGAELAAENITTVTVDDGRLVEHRPDGTAGDLGTL